MIMMVFRWHVKVRKYWFRGNGSKGLLSIYGWYGTGNIAYGTRIFFNCLDTGQEVFFKSLSYGTATFLPIFFINYYVEFEIC